MKVFYWSPFISKVATVSSVIRSAESLLKYSKKKDYLNISIIDAIGEWKNYEQIIDPKISIIKLNKKNVSEFLPKEGFFGSRLSYILIFVLTFGLQLWMFATPIVYPLSIIPDNYKILAVLNPMTGVVELFRWSFFGVTSIEFYHIHSNLFVTFK